MGTVQEIVTLRAGLIKRTGGVLDLRRLVTIVINDVGLEKTQPARYSKMGGSEFSPTMPASRDIKNTVLTIYRGEL